MSYAIDMSQISIDDYQKLLEERYMVPSQMLLKVDLQKRMAYIKSLGIQNLAELLDLLKKKDSFQELAEHNLFTKEYVTVLNRQIKGMVAKPRKLDDFTWISSKTRSTLESAGIKNTKQLYEAVLNCSTRDEFIEKHSLEKNEAEELIKETDLTRMQWVNHTFARVLYEAGYDTVEKVQNADYKKMHEEILSVNTEKEIYKGNIGLNDMKLLVEVAHDVTQEIEW